MTDVSLRLGPDLHGHVLVTEADRVRYFGPEAEAPAANGIPALSAAGARIEPGAVNAHTHLYSGLAPFGLPPPVPAPENFLQILARVWWRLDRVLDAPLLRASARVYVGQALLAGTTSLIDHHESPNFVGGSLDVLAEACEELGMRAVLGYGATERNGGRDEARRGLAECRRFARANRRPGLRGVVALHASFTVSDETVRDAGDICRDLGTVLHVHVAEDGADVEDARRRGYADPFDRLLRLGALPPGSILAHGVHLDAGAVRRVRDEGVWLVQNPRSNRGNRVGYPRALAVSPRVALGTDGYPARMEEETAALLEEGVAHGESRESLLARAHAGADLVGERFGYPFRPLALGAAADIVVREENGSARHVVGGGRLVVKDARLLTGDLESILEEAREAAPRLWARMAALA